MVPNVMLIRATIAATQASSVVPRRLVLDDEIDAEEAEDEADPLPRCYHSPSNRLAIVEVSNGCRPT
jgi:hypothetical protein